MNCNPEEEQAFALIVMMSAAHVGRHGFASKVRLLILVAGDVDSVRQQLMTHIWVPASPVGDLNEVSDPGLSQEYATVAGIAEGVLSGLLSSVSLPLKYIFKTKKKKGEF